MLSRILRVTGDSPVEQMRWPSAGDPNKPAQGQQARGSAPGDPRNDAEHAARRIAELEALVERRATQARQEGFREGEASGHRLAAAEAQPALEKLARSIEDVARLRPRLLRESEAELVELAMSIARRILRRELSVDAEALQGLVRSVLDKLSTREICRIRAHPELEPGIRRCLERETQSGINVIGDATLERGGILVETSRGKLDASLETQLGEIGRGLADRLAER
jgi:flagellar assembly protein FliH